MLPDTDLKNNSNPEHTVILTTCVAWGISRSGSPVWRTVGVAPTSDNNCFDLYLLMLVVFHVWWSAALFHFVVDLL